MNFASGLVDFQLTCPDGQVEISEKYQNFTDSSLISNVYCVINISLTS